MLIYRFVFAITHVYYIFYTSRADNLLYVESVRECENYDIYWLRYHSYYNTVIHSYKQTAATLLYIKHRYYNL